MSLLTPNQSVSHKWFYHCVNHKKKLSLFILLPVFDSFSFFKASLWLLVDKVLQKIQNLIKVRLDFYFNVASWFPANVRVKPHFKTHCPPPPPTKNEIIYEWSLKKTLSDIEDAGGCQGKGKNVCPRTGQACGGGSTSSSGKLYTVK